MPYCFMYYLLYNFPAKLLFYSVKKKEMFVYNITKSIRLTKKAKLIVLNPEKPIWLCG